MKVKVKSYTIFHL